MSDTIKFWPQLAMQLRRAFAPKLLVCWLIASLLTTLVVALPLAGVLHEVLDFSAYAATLAQHLNLDALSAINQAYQHSEIAIQTNVTLAWVCTLLIAPLLAAMATSIYRTSKKLSWSALVAKAAADYGRWFWLHLCAFIAYLFGFGIAAMVAVSAELRVENYTDAHAFAQLRIFSWLLAALIAVMTHFVVEITRAEYVLDTALRVPPEAVLRALSRRRFVRRFAGYLLVCCIGIFGLWLLSIVRQHFSGASFSAMFGTVFLSQCGVALLAWVRTARLFVLAGLLDQAAVAKSFAIKPYHSTRE